MTELPDDMEVVVERIDHAINDTSCPASIKVFGNETWTLSFEDLRALLLAYQERGRDAARFQALMRCGRIKMQGSSGVDPHTGERNGNNVHFGAEFWPEPPKPEYAHLDGGERSTLWGRACLRALADAILEQEARAALNQKGKSQ